MRSGPGGARGLVLRLLRGRPSTTHSEHSHREVQQRGSGAGAQLRSHGELVPVPRRRSAVAWWQVARQSASKESVVGCRGRVARGVAGLELGERGVELGERSGVY